VRALKEEGMPILLSEQNSGFVLRMSDRAYILEKGEVRWDGAVTSLKEDPEILKTYLGV
jgi:branched-chain amino acid transport system ATP-binding protein